MSNATTAAASAPTINGVYTDLHGIYRNIGALDEPCYVVRTSGGVGTTNQRPSDDRSVIAVVGPQAATELGARRFRIEHGVRYAYLAGAMAGGVASEDLVIALAKAGFLASFGAAGLLPDRIERALRRFDAEIPGKPFAANLIHSPSEDELERAAVELYLRHGVRCVEASAFMDLTPHVVRYRVVGLTRDRDGRVVPRNRLIAKVSRPEVAAKFMKPAPESMVSDLRTRGLVTDEQAELAKQVPMADDVTAEADSGGHTDRRPLSVLLPTILRLRDSIQREYRYLSPILVGAAGGIGTPRAVFGAFALGADFVVIGSVHQSCVESGTSDSVRSMLASAGTADFEMAPAADMFELGVELQVLKRGTMFPMRAKRLYELYRSYDGMAALPDSERSRLESQIFKRPLEEIWADVVEYFTRRDPAQLERANGDPRRAMALVFRWYLGMASRWASVGEPDRVADYQIWCGPSMGAFNEWAHGSYLAGVANRRVAEVAWHLMTGAAFTARTNQLLLAGVRLPAVCTDYRPEPLDARAPGGPA